MQYPMQEVQMIDKRQKMTGRGSIRKRNGKCKRPISQRGPSSRFTEIEVRYRQCLRYFLLVRNSDRRTFAIAM